MLLNKIKIRLELEDDSKDLLISDLIDDVTEEVIEYLNEKELPKKAESIVKELVIIKFNKLGSEGLQSESFSGASQSFINDIPGDILRKLKRLRKLPKRY